MVDEELLKEAEKSQIKEHIDGKNIIVVKEPNISSAIQYMSGVNAANYYANCVEEGYPSEEYCNQIINWLCKKSVDTQEYENRTKASVSLIIFSFILSVVLMFLVGIFNIVAGFVAALVITLIAVSILIKYLIENIKAKRISGIVIEMLSIIVCLSINIGVCYYFLINLS